MARYRKVACNFWYDEKVHALSDDSRTLFIMILTHPLMTPLGAAPLNPGGLAYELRWTERRCMKSIKALVDAGLLRWQDRMVWVPSFFKHNRPESPNVVRSWAGCLDMLPECELRDEVLQSMQELAADMGKPFEEAVASAFPFLKKRARTSQPLPSQSQTESHRASMEEKAEMQEEAGEPEPEQAQAMPEAFGEALPEALAKGCGQASANQEQEQEHLYLRKLSHTKSLRLEGEELAGFERFWQAFDYPHGRRKAEAAWHELGVDAGEVGRIVAAAATEAARRPELERRRQIPKQAAGWLLEGRYLDYVPRESARHEPEMPKPLEGEARERADAAMARCMARFGIRAKVAA